MNVGRKITTGLAAAVVTAGLVLAPPSAQAGSLERGLVAGLLGGLAVGALAAAAQAQQPAVAPPSFAGEVEAVEEWSQPPRRVPVRQTRTRPRAAEREPVRPQAQRTPARQVSSIVERCESSLVARARQFGSAQVRVASAGSEVRSRDGVVALPVEARIEYARGDTKHVRQARVTCRIDRQGRVIEIR